MLFSILLPTYKQRFLQECIESVLAQTYSDWELIIVNDASPEDIRSIVQTYTDPRIHYYENKQNIGAIHVVQQWNTCLQYASGQYSICIGDDDRFTPECLSTYARLIEQYPEVEVLHGQTDIINGSGQVIAHTVQRPEWESAISMLYHRTYLRRPQFIGDFCYQTAALKARGGYYDLPLAWGSDDISALLAATTHGIANTQEVVFQYRSNELSITSQKYIVQKCKAVIQEAKWRKDFLQQIQQDPQDEIFRKRLLKDLPLITLKKIYYILLNTIHA